VSTNVELGAYQAEKLRVVGMYPTISSATLTAIAARSPNRRMMNTNNPPATSRATRTSR